MKLINTLAVVAAVGTLVVPGFAQTSPMQHDTMHKPMMKKPMAHDTMHKPMAHGKMTPQQMKAMHAKTMKHDTMKK